MPYPTKNHRETLVVSETTRKVMKANRSKDTKLEVAIRKALWKAGIRGYRKHRSDLPGKPDLVFGRQKLCVFVHGCYWHGCQKCGGFKVPKTNSRFWAEKIVSNIERDLAVQEKLVNLGFRVLVVWECEVESSVADCVSRIAEALSDERC